MCGDDALSTPGKAWLRPLYRPFQMGGVVRGLFDQCWGAIICNIIFETRSAIDNIEAICAVEGITALIPAPHDLSVELGCPGQFDTPAFLKAVEQFERATTAAKVAKSAVATTEEQLRSAIARGYANVMLGWDVLMLKNAATSAVSWIK